MTALTLPSDLDRTLARQLRDWIEVPSVTGDEADYAEALARELERRGFSVERQPVESGEGAPRYNLLARAGDPKIVWCTHLDTVPPFFGSSEDSDFVYGRGSCDAKGQAACMVAAASALLEAGEDRLGFLFTVGEEIDGIGAQVARDQLRVAPASERWSPAFTFVGEPTGSRFVRGHKGVLKATLRAEGVAGHSSQDIGPSAVHELIGCTHRLLGADWTTHSVLGSGTINIGEISGGVAPNVVAAHASASVLARIVQPFEDARKTFESCLSPHVHAPEEPYGYGPVEFTVPKGEEDAPVVAFGTDAPYLDGFGERLLFGPGEILDAHTPGEKVGKRDMALAAARHVAVARELFQTLDA